MEFLGLSEFSKMLIDADATHFRQTSGNTYFDGSGKNWVMSGDFVI